jgi:hypothetical protein
MAENESLDLFSPDANRWKKVLRAITDNQPNEAVARQILDAFYDGLRRACKQMAKLGVKLSDLLEAARSPEDLRRLVIQAQGHSYVRSFEQVAVCFTGGSREVLLTAYLRAIWGKVHDQICSVIEPAASDASPSGPHAQLGNLQGEIDAMIGRLAQKLADDPSQIPAKPRRRKGTPAPSLPERLSQSLL